MTHGLIEEDLEKVCDLSGLSYGKKEDSAASLRDRLTSLYTGTTGFEYTHITDLERVDWLRDRIELLYSSPDLDKQQATTLLERLTNADAFERFLAQKWSGVRKRTS